MAKRINEMESQFIAGIKAGLTQQQAALNAGYSPKTAHTQASQLMRKPKIIACLDEWSQIRAVSLVYRCGHGNNVNTTVSYI